MGKLLCVVVGLQLFTISSYALKYSHPAIDTFSSFNVYLSIEGETKKGESFVGQCNGSLIADDLVVTAAHCVAGSSDFQDGVKVHVGKYKLIESKSGRVFANYHHNLDVIQSKKIIVPSAIKKKIDAKKLLHAGSISGFFDVALIELERPIDRSKVDVNLIEPVTTAEHDHIKANAAQYPFVVVSTNLVAEMSTQTKRYAYLPNMRFKSLINTLYVIPMLNGLGGAEVEEGDSGAPVLVAINGAWKLFAVVKGIKRDFASTQLDLLKREKIINSEINITPKVNMFSPIANRMCDLLKQANRDCN